MKRMGAILGGLILFMVLVLTIYTVRNPEGYPVWVCQSFYTLAIAGSLWAVLMIITSRNIRSLTRNQINVLNLSRLAAFGVMVGVGLTLALAGDW